MIKLRHLAAASAVVLTLAVEAPPASAQWIVYDPTNFSQNVLTAARELQQINNQIQMLTNQATSLVNQARNLANLPMSTLTQLQSSIAQTQSLLGQAQNIAFNVQHIEQAYSTSYGSAAGTGSTSAMVANAQTRWQNSVGAFEDSLKVQAGVVGNIPTNSSAMTSLVSASQNATGALQAAQAGNQLLALQSQQLSDLVAVLSAKGRADALEQARSAAAEAQGQQNYKTFSTRTGYPGPDCGGDLYWDDGHSRRRDSDAVLRQHLSCETRGAALTLTFSARAGGFAPWWKRLDVAIYGRSGPPGTVRLDGHVVASRWDAAARVLHVDLADQAGPVVLSVD